MTISNLQKGQALITLLVFVVVATTIITGAVAVSIVNSQATSKMTVSQEAYMAAQAGAENAMLRLLRNPNYTGETLTVGSGTATITVSGASTKTIISEGISGDFHRKIQVSATFNNNALSVNSWSEID